MGPSVHYRRYIVSQQGAKSAKALLWALLLCLAPTLFAADPPTVADLAGAQFPGVTIYQEHEGNLHFPAEDALGDVFDYYQLAAKYYDKGVFERTVVQMTFLERSRYWVSHRLWGRGVWTALPTRGKLIYLHELEKSAHGAACWIGESCQFLEKRPEAPEYLEQHPRMEMDPEGKRSFFLPEIVTDRDHPALTANQALDRALSIVKQTGHAGVHFHVFVSVDPDKLRAQLPALEASLQLLNDAMYLKAGHDAMVNLFRANTLPWHEGKARTVEQIVAQASPNPHTPDWGSPDNEKGASLAFRYWGMENGKMRISLELRGLNLPLVRPPVSTVGARGLEEGGGHRPPAFRDPSILRYYLTIVAALAHNLENGDLTAPAVPTRRLDLAEAEARLAAAARAQGIPAEHYFGIAAFTKKALGYETVSYGLLMPLSGPDTPAQRAYIKAFLKLSMEAARTKNSADLQRYFGYQLWESYREWAQAENTALDPAKQALIAQNTGILHLTPVSATAICRGNWIAVKRALAPTKR